MVILLKFYGFVTTFYGCSTAEVKLFLFKNITINITIDIMETSEKLPFMESSNHVAGKYSIDTVNGLQNFAFCRGLNK